MPNTMNIPRWLSDWRGKEFWNLAAVAWAAMLLDGALVLEHGFGMAPCALCMTQRGFALLAGLAAAAGLAHNPRLAVYPLLAVAAAAAGAWSSIRHLYLLTLPEDELAGCGVDFDYMIDVFPLAEVLSAMLSGTGECAEQSWVVPGLALAGFVGMAALAVLYWRRTDATADAVAPRFGFAKSPSRRRDG